MKKITSDTAEIWGLKDRGALKQGYAADIVVFDPATIGRGAERPVFDMPGEGMRYVARLDRRRHGGGQRRGRLGQGRLHRRKAGEICALD